MRIAKVQSRVLDEALKTGNYPALKMYISGFCGFERTSDGCFVSKVVKDSDNKPVLEINLALQDYLFNERPESFGIWNFAKNLIGKETIDMKVLNIVEL